MTGIKGLLGSKKASAAALGGALVVTIFAIAAAAVVFGGADQQLLELAKWFAGAVSGITTALLAAQGAGEFGRERERVKAAAAQIHGPYDMPPATTTAPGALARPRVPAPGPPRRVGARAPTPPTGTARVTSSTLAPLLVAAGALGLLGTQGCAGTWSGTYTRPDSGAAVTVAIEMSEGTDEDAAEEAKRLGLRPAEDDGGGGSGRE